MPGDTAHTAPPAEGPEPARTKTGYVIRDWRDTDRRDWCGEVIREALIEGIGWCQYSWRLSAILINGRWHSF